MDVLIDDLSGKLDDVVSQMQVILEQEDRSAAADDNLKELEGKAQHIRARLEEAVRVAEMRKSGTDLMSRQVRARARSAVDEVETRTAGTVFTESRAFADYRGHGQTAPVMVPLLETRATLLTSTDLGDNPQPQRVPGFAAPTRTTLWDILTKITVSSGSVEYPVYSHGSDAAIVAEGTAKPEMTWAMTLVEKTIPKVAHHYAYSREFAQDKPALKSIIDGELTNGVRRKLNTEAATTIGAVATPAVTGATLLEAIRNAQAEVESIEDGYMADTLLINPADAAALDLSLLSATSEGARYGFPVWGLRVVKSTKVAAGKPLVLDSSAVVVYLRTGVEVFVTDSHSDYFLKNCLVAVAEARALTVVQRPDLVVPASVAP